MDKLTKDMIQEWLVSQEQHLRCMNTILNSIDILFGVHLESLDTNKIEMLCTEFIDHLDSVTQKEVPLAELIEAHAKDISETMHEQYIEILDAVEDFIIRYNDFLTRTERKNNIYQSQVAQAAHIISSL